MIETIYSLVTGYLIYALIVEIMNSIPVHYTIKQHGKIWLVKRKRWFRWKTLGTFSSMQDALDHVAEDK